MTEHKNTNPFDEQPTSGDDNAWNHDSQDKDKGSAQSKSDDWAMFLSEHQDDMGSIEHSRNAKRFEKHVKREQKKAALNVRDLRADSFADTQGADRGPRDFTGSSWLDTDDVMDEGNDFVPPNPAIGPVRSTTLVYVIFIILGVLALGAAIFIAQFASLLGTIGGVLTILGAAGLFYQHRGHTETRRDPFDDGSRV
ncbi:MAG: CvpA family protein [Bifidobacterium aquikefiri]|uniref:Membrane associated protein n=1 Tax=Bifidobacterium aquikefiri TaxID=1653207 RepID=A0A261G5P2_9BIFI|nr:CvpA family protein [Bifidobacterium aquikefiri]OZG66732.1 hypothetical protein BAQU_0804 [Bifidobacterium aquikefiri]